MTKAVNYIGLVGNLADYPHDDAARDKVLTALTEAVSAVRFRFEKEKRGKRSAFYL